MKQSEKIRGHRKKGVKGSYAQFLSQLNETKDALVSLDTGASGSGTVSANVYDEVLLRVSGFGTPDNPIVICKIQNSDNAVIACGHKSCEYIFKAGPNTFAEYYGTMTFKDGSKAKYDWQVSRALPEP